MCAVLRKKQDDYAVLFFCGFVRYALVFYETLKNNGTMKSSIFQVIKTINSARNVVILYSLPIWMPIGMSRS